MMELLFILIAGHALADYPLQGDFLAKGKNHKAPIAGDQPNCFSRAKSAWKWNLRFTLMKTKSSFPYPQHKRNRYNGRYYRPKRLFHESERRAE